MGLSLWGEGGGGCCCIYTQRFSTLELRPTSPRHEFASTPNSPLLRLAAAKQQQASHLEARNWRQTVALKVALAPEGCLRRARDGLDHSRHSPPPHNLPWCSAVLLSRAVHLWTPSAPLGV